MHVQNSSAFFSANARINYLKILLLCSSVLYFGWISCAHDVFAQTAEPSAISSLSIDRAIVRSQKDDRLRLTFEVRNDGGAESLLHPVVLLYKTGGTGDVVDRYQDAAVYVFRENSTTLVQLVYEVPAVSAGEYDLYIALQNERGMVLGTGYVQTVTLEGVGSEEPFLHAPAEMGGDFVIEHATIERSSYVIGETAKVIFQWDVAPLTDEERGQDRPPERFRMKPNAEVSVVDSDTIPCGENTLLSSLDVGGSRETAEMTIVRDCTFSQVRISLKGEDGEILDEAVFPFYRADDLATAEKKETQDDAARATRYRTLFVLFAATVLLAIAAIAVVVYKKRKGWDGGNTTLLFAIVLSVSTIISFSSFNVAQALDVSYYHIDHSTWPFSGDDVEFTVDLNKAEYVPGETMTLTVNMTDNDSSSDNGLFEAGVDGDYTAIIINDLFELVAPQIEGMPAPLMPGSYALTFQVTGNGAVPTDQYSIPFEVVDPSVPFCDGKKATVYVKDGTIIGGPDNGAPYTGTLTGPVASVPSPVIIGTDGDDTIVGRSLSDTICGGLGNDTITQGNGIAIVFGNAGDDTIDVGSGDDYVYGGDGNDTITVRNGIFFVDAGAGNDMITSMDGSGISEIHCGDGNDTVAQGSGIAEIFGDEGDDIITATSGGIFDIHGGDGNDVVTAGDGVNNIFGDDGDDWISAGDGAGEFRGGEGDDVIITRPSSGIVEVYGEEDDDMIFTSGPVLGIVTFNGGSGSDALCGEASILTLIGGTGNDTLSSPNALMVDFAGGPGSDHCYGVNVDDMVGCEFKEAGTAAVCDAGAPAPGGFINKVPNAIISVPISGSIFVRTGDTITFNGSASFDEDGSVANYAWFTSESGLVCSAADPIPSGSGSNKDVMSKPASIFGVGIYTVSLQVTDDDGDSGCASVMVDVRDAECNNGSDDGDADKLADENDPGCWSYNEDGTQDVYEEHKSTEEPEPQCFDGVDNDGDGKIDFDGNGDPSFVDLGCGSEFDNKESICGDGFCDRDESFNNCESDCPFGYILD